VERQNPGRGNQDAGYPRPKRFYRKKKCLTTARKGKGSKGGFGRGQDETLPFQHAYLKKNRKKKKTPAFLSWRRRKKKEVLGTWQEGGVPEAFVPREKGNLPRKKLAGWVPPAEKRKEGRQKVEKEKVASLEGKRKKKKKNAQRKFHVHPAEGNRERLKSAESVLGGRSFRARRAVLVCGRASEKK